MCSYFWDASFVPPALNCLWIYIWWSLYPFSSRSSPFLCTPHGSVAHGRLKTGRNTTKKSQSSLAGGTSLNICLLLVGMEKGCLEVYMAVLPLHELAQQFSVTVAWEGEFCQMDVFPWQTFSASALGDVTVFICTGSQLKSCLTCRSLHVPLAAAIGPAGHGLKYRWASGKPLVLTKKLTNMDCDEATRFIPLTAIITQKTTIVYHYLLYTFFFYKNRYWDINKTWKLAL